MGLWDIHPIGDLLLKQISNFGTIVFLPFYPLKNHLIPFVPKNLFCFGNLSIFTNDDKPCGEIEKQNVDTVLLLVFQEIDFTNKNDEKPQQQKEHTVSDIESNSNNNSNCIYCTRTV